jgi:adenylate kinase family enzyme
VKAYIVYNDSFIIGVEKITDSIERLYNCTKVDINDIYRKESIKETSVAKEMHSFLERREIAPDNLYHELVMTEIVLLNSNVIIQNYPRTQGQWNLLKDFFENSGITVEKIWYLEAINVLSNIRKVEKYKIKAENHDPTLSHIKKKIIRSKLANLERIDFLSNLEILEIIGVESFGIGGSDYLESIITGKQV